MAAGNWQDDENDAIVADYFTMLARELAGEPFSKTAHGERSRTGLAVPRDRSSTSIRTLARC